MATKQRKYDEKDWHICQSPQMDHPMVAYFMGVGDRCIGLFIDHYKPRNGGLDYTERLSVREYFTDADKARMKTVMGKVGVTCRW